VVVKVLGATTSETELRIDKLLQPSAHEGKQHVEIAPDSFIILRPNGHHFCKVLEPLGRAFSSVLETAFEKRAELNPPQVWLGKAVDGDLWSVQFAKRACWQILLGLDYLHSQRIAHRDIQPANICMALEYDLSSLNENEIQSAVWRVEGEKDAKGEKLEQPEENRSDAIKDTSPEDEASSDEDTDSNGGQEEWQREFEEGKMVAKDQWQAFEAGDMLAEPHSVEWNKSNFFNWRHNIELLQRRDGKPLKPGEIHYTVAATPLDRRI
jgi:hypothetical protein